MIALFQNNRTTNKSVKYLFLLIVLASLYCAFCNDDSPCEEIGTKEKDVRTIDVSDIPLNYTKDTVERYKHLIATPENPDCPNLRGLGIMQAAIAM